MWTGVGSFQLSRGDIESPGVIPALKLDHVQNLESHDIKEH